MIEHKRSAHQWQLWLIVITLGAPLPLAWAAWYWQIGIPDGKTVSGVLLPNTTNLFSWPLQPLGERYHAENPLVELQKKQPWYLVFNCTSNCRSDELWRLHRALGRDADRLVRFTLTTTPTSTTNYNQPLPGSYWWRLDHKNQETNKVLFETSNQDHAIWLADPSGKIVLAYENNTDLTTLLRDIRKVLRRNPEKPSWMPLDQSTSGHHTNQSLSDSTNRYKMSVGEVL